jgi:hypothetical protein
MATFSRLQQLACVDGADDRDSGFDPGCVPSCFSRSTVVDVKRDAPEVLIRAVRAESRPILGEPSPGAELRLDEMPTLLHQGPLHLPDGVVVSTHGRQWRTAVEVELIRKTEAEVAGVLRQLLGTRDGVVYRAIPDAGVEGAGTGIRAASGSSSAPSYRRPWRPSPRSSPPSFAVTLLGGSLTSGLIGS